MKKIIAGFLTAIMTLVTLISPVLAATDLATYPTFLGPDGTPDFYVVVANTAAASDIVGAIDLAIRLAELSYTTTTAAATEAVSVTSGVDISTTNTKLYLGDALNTAKSTLTKTDLPTLLASDKVTVSGTEYKYDLYLALGTRTVTFDNSGESIDPILYVDMGTSSAAPTYTAMVVFNKPLNVTSTTVQGKTLTLLGNDYTIASTSTGTSLVLFGAGSTQTLVTGEPVTVTVGGTEYTVELTFVSSSSTILLKVGDTTSDELSAGSSDVIGGLNVYVKSVLYSAKTGENSMAILNLGTEKLTLGNGDKVKYGETPTSIDNTLVTLSGSGGAISKIEIAVAAQDTTGDYIASGKAYTDPVFKTFKLAFNGITPALDSATRDTIEIAPSGNNAATLKYTDYRGNTKTISFAYDSDTATGTVTPTLADTSGYVYHVREGEYINENEYFVYSQGDFSHIYKLTDIDDVTESTAKVEIQDIFDGSTVTINLDSPAYTNTTTYIDGQSVYVLANTTTANFTWGTGASAGLAGTQTTLFPLVKGKNGQLVALVKTITGIANGTTLTLPGGDGDTGTTDVLIYNATAGPSSAEFDAGRLSYNVSWSATPTFTIAGVGQRDAGSYVDLTDNYPAVVLIEEKGKDTTSTDRRDAVIVETTYYGTAPAKMAISSTITMTAATKGTERSLVSNTYIKKNVDRFGTLYTADTYEQGKVTISYPDDQGYMNLAMGTDPSFTTTATTAATYNVVKGVATSVAKLDTEMDATTKAAKNIVLVGGPCRNTLVEELAIAGEFDYTCASWPTDKFAIIKAVDDYYATGKVALVVAGTTRTETRLACSVLQDYANANVKDKLTGSAVKITGTAVSTATIEAA